ncbi:hypothetical protein RvY_15302 [Ramazzottius varieornatus]|uniref:Uncharacterized protein n=1 Tax=Ramazzottius varieornatus TaxID=947166 RepID=A0A1D1VW13_RAMVA|nr:hypothetical protein RvY_15302 [Ramazzottius varieornatus]
MDGRDTISCGKQRFPMSDADLSDLVSSEITSSTPAADSDVKEIPKLKRRSEKEMDSDTTAARAKLTRGDETFEGLLAVDGINPYQYPPGKECTLALKVALRHSSSNIYQPKEPEIMPETEKEIKAHLPVLVDQEVKEFKEKHLKRLRESGDEENPVNIGDLVIQFLAEKKDNRPSAVLKADQRSPEAVNRDESLIRGMSTGNKATEPLCSVGDKDTSDVAKEHAQDVRANLDKTLSRRVNNPATVVRA